MLVWHYTHSISPSHQSVRLMAPGKRQKRSSIIVITSSAHKYSSSKCASSFFFIYLNDFVLNFEHSSAQRVFLLLSTLIKIKKYKKLHFHYNSYVDIGNTRRLLCLNFCSRSPFLTVRRPYNMYASITQRHTQTHGSCYHRISERINDFCRCMQAHTSAKVIFKHKKMLVLVELAFV